MATRLSRRVNSFRRIVCAMVDPRRPCRLTCWWAAIVAVSSLVAGVARGETAIAERPTDDATKQAEAENAKLGHDWVRVLKNDRDEIVGMQTAIVRYASPTGAAKGGKAPVEVDLIGAVHIGDRAYYQQLNERFTKYDTLLYELVAPEGTVVERGRGTSNAHPVGALQNGIKSLLELEHQLELVDYTKPNFVHADMSPDQFAKSMQDRNESFLQLYFRMLGQSMAQQSEMAARGESLDFDLLSALFARDRPRRLKMALAKQLAEMESMMVSLGGDEGSVIISERNKIALEVLKKELAAGKRHVGIFYGAGHLNDMDERLRDDFGLEPQSITWITAWDLKPPAVSN